MSTKALAIKEETITALDTAAASYQLSIADATPFKKAFLLAEAINNMRSLLTDEVMKPIMALMNTDLGFRTDKDPRVWNSKKNNGQGGYNDSYGVDVIRDVMIESSLRGFYPVNNEFNVIAGRFYAAKNGVRRKVVTWSGLTDLKDTRAVPRMSDKGAVVATSASWKLNGKSDSLEIEIAIKVNDMMGSDAILGKAERKQMKLILDRISGEITPDGDVDDAPPTGTSEVIPPTKAKVETAKKVTGTDTTLPKRGGATHEEVTKTQDGGTTAETPQQPSTAATPADGGPTQEEQEQIQRQEAEAAAREFAQKDPENGLRSLMALDQITEDELGFALRAFRIAIPRDYKGPENLTDKVILSVMETKVWQTIVLHIKKNVRTQPAP